MDPEIEDIVQFLDPLIVEIDCLISGSKNDIKTPISAFKNPENYQQMISEKNCK